ncbi:MAG TPA: carbonic anhydrase family protein [Puia sp.]|nr:carbonic anhydrase family protein [Puia sp.]
MKNFSHFLGVVLLFILSCNAPDKEIQQKDSTLKEPSDTAAIGKNADNEVRSEAPDAKTKTDQGYGSPKHDNGKFQSPIDILTSDVKNDRGHAVTIKFQTAVIAAENLGHTIQLDFKDGSTCSMNGKIYQAKQFHFHTPSEHLIDGMTFPLEMHIVSILQDSNTKTKPSYLVIGVLFKMGKENKFIRSFFNAVPNEEHKKDSIPPGAVNFDDFSVQILKNSKNAFYQYKGSLTTPPFTEAVDWIVLKQILEASPDQVMAIEKMQGNNARHVQALYDREVSIH